MKSISCPNCGCIIAIAGLSDGEEKELTCDHCNSELFVFAESGELKVELVSESSDEGSSDDYNIDTYNEE